MQSLKPGEIAALANGLESLVNSRLQRVESGEDWISFLFYGEGQEKPLFLSLKPSLPVLLPMRAPRSLKKKTIPALLFLKAHFDNHILRQVSHDPTEGRVLRLHFSNGGVVEIRLFPHGQNLIARLDDKRLSTHKVNELQASGSVSTRVEVPDRTVDQLIEEYESIYEKKAASANGGVEVKKEQIEKALAKKERALELVEKDLKEKTESPFRQVGEWLKAHQSLDVPNVWSAYVDRQKSFAENLNAVFQKAKQTDEKLINAQKRVDELKKEIEKLKAGEWLAPQATQSPLKKAGAKGRTIELTGGRLLFLGRSAEENMKLLRASQPWDYWLHIKDFPGSHGIIRRNKQETISDAVFIEALQHLVGKQFGAKGKVHDGEKYSCFIAECRFVKPIKGDRIGRVNYQNERVLTIQFKS